jgi:hypothetical protein
LLNVYTFMSITLYGTQLYNLHISIFHYYFESVVVLELPEINISAIEKLSLCYTSYDYSVSY